MTENKPPREWWIREPDNHFEFGSVNFSEVYVESVHVIEHSSYAAAIARIAELEIQLDLRTDQFRTCVDGSHVKDLRIKAIEELAEASVEKLQKEIMEDAMDMGAISAALFCDDEKMKWLGCDEKSENKQYKKNVNAVIRLRYKIEKLESENNLYRKEMGKITQGIPSEWAYAILKKECIEYKERAEKAEASITGRTRSSYIKELLKQIEKLQHDLRTVKILNKL